MDESINEEKALAEDIGCKNCGKLDIEEGYRLRLCKECRDSLSKKATPIWIKISSCIILLIMIFALIQFPSSIAAGIEFEKGVKAEREKKLVTALNHYKKAAKKYPNSTLVMAKLFIAYGNNNRLDEAAQAFKSLEGKKSSDKELLKQVNNTISYMNSLYNVSDELAGILSQKKTLNELYSTLRDHCTKNPSDAIGLSYLGNTLFDMGKYSQAREAYLKSVKIDPNLYMIKLNIAATYRQTGEIDKAVELCNEVLKYNAEDASAYSSLSKIELKRHKYDKALELAQKAYGFDKDDMAIAENMAIVYHYNKMTKERDEMFRILKDNNYPDLDKVQSIFDGKLKIYE